MVPPPDTRSGGVLESMVIHALELGNYKWAKQHKAGTRLGGGDHRVDVLAVGSDGRKHLVSMKWQEVSGTAEQKVPFEVMCLLDAIRHSGEGYEDAYVVLGGEGWKRRDFFVGGGMQEYMPHPEVKVITLEAFIKLANRGKL
jgi:hypothetical protein